MAITRYLSFVEEATHGTPVLTGGETIDPLSAEIEPSGDTTLIYEGASRLDKLVAPGPYINEGEISTAFDDKAFPWFIKWALGGYEVTGSGPYTHRFYPSPRALMQPFTVRVGKDIFEHIYSGCVVSTLGIEYDREFVNGNVEIISGRDSQQTVVEGPEFTQGNVYAGCNVTVEIDATDQSTYVETFTLNIETGADSESGITVGSRYPRRSFQGAVMVELEMTMSFFDTSQLELFWGDPAGPLGCNVGDFPMTIHVGDNVDIVLPRLTYTNVSIPLPGRDRIEQTVTARGLVAADGSGPVEFSITNDIESYTVTP